VNEPEPRRLRRWPAPLPCPYLMDDMDGRAAAKRLGVLPVFTVAILERGAEKGLIDLPAAVAKLRQTNFFVSQKILEAALERDKHRIRK